MDILTQTISLLFRHRQTEIGRFGQDIDHIQRKQLHALLSTARKTEWGLKYDYKASALIQTSANVFLYRLMTT